MPSTPLTFEKIPNAEPFKAWCAVWGSRWDAGERSIHGRPIPAPPPEFFWRGRGPMMLVDKPAHPGALIFPRHLVNGEVERIKSELRDGVPQLGELLTRPPSEAWDGMIRLAMVSHRLENVGIDRDMVIGTVMLLPTERGQMAASILSAGRSLYGSFRAIGNVDDQTVTTLTIKTFDLVCE